MAIRKWHYGKLIILWGWGGLLSALALTHFETTKVADSPILHACEFIGVVVILVVLSVLTWMWLGGKDSI